MENNPEESLLRNNPVFVIGIACVLAGIMMAISIVLYLRSDTRKTIEQIQTNNNTKQSSAVDLPENGVVTSEYVTDVEKKIVKNIQSLDDEADFSPDELTDAALGL